MSQPVRQLAERSSKVQVLKYASAAIGVIQVLFGTAGNTQAVDPGVGTTIGLADCLVKAEHITGAAACADAVNRRIRPRFRNVEAARPGGFR